MNLVDRAAPIINQMQDAELRVRRAAPWLSPFPIESWLVSHRELKTSRRVRLVFDWLAAEMMALPVLAD